MAEATPDEAAILATYHPTESSFELPAATSVSDPTTKYKSDRTPYSLASPSSRTVKVTHIDFAPFLSNAGVRGMVTNVSHGTFHSRPASLIIFSFSLRSGEHGFRFKNANIKITFSKHPTASSASELSPAVIKFAPRKIYGLPVVEGRKNRIGGEMTLQVPAGPITLGPTIRGERESEYEKEHRFKTVGNFWSSKQGMDWDIVYWDMRENKRTKEGIPDRLNVGVVVEREGPFVAEVEVTVDTPVLNGAFSYPWTKNNPATFVPGVKMGEQPSTERFEELSEGEWKELIPYEDEWENKLTEVALHRMEGDRIPVHASGRASSEGIVAARVEAAVLEEEESDDR
jgi:hypothetical protein